MKSPYFSFAVGMLLLVAGLVGALQSSNEANYIARMTAEEVAARLSRADHYELPLQGDLELDKPWERGEFPLTLREGADAYLDNFTGPRPEVSNGQRLYTIEVSQ